MHHAATLRCANSSSVPHEPLAHASAAVVQHKLLDPRTATEGTHNTLTALSPCRVSLHCSIFPSRLPCSKVVLEEVCRREAHAKIAVTIITPDQKAAKATYNNSSIDAVNIVCLKH